MIDGTRLVLAALAAFRVNWSLIHDDGLFFHIRRLCGAYDLDVDTAQPRTALGRWWICPYCTGLLAAAIGMILYLWQPLDPVLLWLGLAGALMILVRWRNW